MKSNSALFSLAVVLLLAVECFSQNTATADDLAAIAKDNAITNRLRLEGIKYETNRAVVWAEGGSLNEQELRGFAALVNQGIIDIEKYTGIKFDKKHYQAAKIEYFLSSEAGLSHRSMENKPFVYIRPILVREKRAPYLHETTHVIAWKTIGPLWLQEGFPNHVQTYVSSHYGGYPGSWFNPENTPINQLARNLLRDGISQRVLPLIGMDGTPFTMTEEEWKRFSFIWEDRKVAAPAFYSLSESFVTFLVERVGIKKMRKIIETQATRAGIEKVTGKSVDEWKAEWLRTLAG